MSEVSGGLKNLLEQWELEEYLDRFSRAKIVKVSTLKLMTEGSAEKLFPEEGLRLEFWAHLCHVLSNNRTCADIQPELSLRREKYLKYGLSLGPLAVVVGEADAPQQSYLIIKQILYEFESPMKALDIAFKAMFALDAAYPKESVKEWLFLQRAVYGVETACDKVFLDSRVNSLIAEYKMFK